LQKKEIKDRKKERQEERQTGRKTGRWTDLERQKERIREKEKGRGELEIKSVKVKQQKWQKKGTSKANRNEVTDSFRESMKSSASLKMKKNRLTWHRFSAYCRLNNKGETTTFVYKLTESWSSVNKNQP